MGGRRHCSDISISVKLAVLTISDSRTTETDESGAKLKGLLERAGHVVLDYKILPDDPEAVRAAVESWLRIEDCSAVITTGGTGISARDQTLEALAGIFDKRLDGFGELFRMLSFEQVGSAAMLSRASAGVVGGKPVFSLPGSPAAVELALEKLILPELGHILSELRA